MTPPKGSPLSRLFGRSPFGALFKHIEAVDQGTARLPDFLAAAQADDWRRAAEIHDDIVAGEHTADDLKDEIRLNLPRRLFLPISRGELLELIEAQDKIINKVKDISGLMLGRRMRFPESVADDIAAYVDTAISAVAKSRELLGHFDELLASGFARDAAEVISESVDELGALEKRADGQERAIRQALLAIESDLAPLDVMFVYRIVDWIGTLADRAERVGSRLQILAAQ